MSIMDKKKDKNHLQYTAWYQETYNLRLVHGPVVKNL